MNLAMSCRVWRRLVVVDANGPPVHILRRCVQTPSFDHLAFDHGEAEERIQGSMKERKAEPEPTGGWAIKSKAARATLDQSPLSESKEATIRQLHTMDPKVWTKSRLSRAFRLPVLAIAQVLDPSDRYSSPFVKNQRRRTRVTRTAAHGLQEAPWSTGAAVRAAVQYGLRGDAMSEFVNEKLSLDWNVPRHLIAEYARRAEEQGLRGPDASTFVRRMIVGYQKRLVHVDQAPHRPLDAGEREVYDDDAMHGASPLQDAAQFELELEAKLRTLKADTHRQKSLRRRAHPSQNLPSVAEMEERERGLGEDQAAADENETKQYLEAPAPDEMLWNLEIEDDVGCGDGDGARDAKGKREGAHRRKWS